MGSMGKGIPGSFVTVIDDDGKEVGPNVKGNIAVPLDLPALFKGYFKDEARTKQLQQAIIMLLETKLILIMMVISGSKVAVTILSLVQDIPLDLSR